MSSASSNHSSQNSSKRGGGKRFANGSSSRSSAGHASTASQEEDVDAVFNDMQIPLGADAERARKALLVASDDALGVGRRQWVRRIMMVLTVLLFLAVAAALAFLAQQVLSVADLVATQLSDASFIRAVADDDAPIDFGAIVSWSASGGVIQGHGAAVGTALSNLPCQYSRVFFTAQQEGIIVSAAMTTTESVTLWTVDTKLQHQLISNMTVNATAEYASAAPHVALAGTGSVASSTNDKVLIVAAATSGASSVIAHVVDLSAKTSESLLLATYFTTNSDRSGAFAVAMPKDNDGVVVGYTCGDDLCCIDAVSWSGTLLFNGPRLNMPRCPDHALLQLSSTDDAAKSSPLLILPTLPVLAMSVNVTNSSMTLLQALRLPVSLRSVGNSSTARLRVASIPVAHARRSVLVAVALQDTILLYQVELQTSSSSTTTTLSPQLFTSIRTGLTGPVELTGLVFSRGESVASIHYTDGNQLHYVSQISFATGATSGEVSPPSALPSVVGTVEFEHLWLAEPWRTTMVIARETSKLCALKRVEWQGGIRFAGIAGSTAQAGQSVDVYTGGLVRIFANLVPGALYGAGVNGSLVPIYDPHSVAATPTAALGRANSKTEMYLFPSR